MTKTPLIIFSLSLFFFFGCSNTQPIIQCVTETSLSKGKVIIQGEVCTTPVVRSKLRSDLPVSDQDSVWPTTINEPVDEPETPDIRTNEPTLEERETYPNAYDDWVGSGSWSPV